MDVFQIDCSRCCDCLPCYVGLDIPEIFRIYNRFLAGEESEAAEEYRALEKKAGDCTRCARCEKACRNRLGISALMLEIREEME